jgi:imidazolonepropionase-like amidohydrolase
VIVVRNGTIASEGEPGPSPDAHVIDATGRLVTAGFVDLATQTGLVEVDLEPSTHDDVQSKKHEVRAAFRAADGYDPASSVVPITRKQGVTSVGVLPAGGLVSGQSAWADLDGSDAADALALPEMALHVVLGDPWTWQDMNRATAMLRLRELFDDARAFEKNAAAFERAQVRKLAASRLDLAVVVRALRGKLPVVFHVDRASDIQNVLALARQHKLRAVLASAAEGWKVAAAIARAKVPCIVNPLDHGPRSFSALGAREDNAARLHAAGVSVAITTGETHNARKLRQVAGNAVRAGLPREAALAAVTLVPARIAGLEARYGTLEKGKVANLVVWSGDPFELSSRAEHVVVRGRPVSLRTRQTALFERYR